MKKISKLKEYLFFSSIHLYIFAKKIGYARNALSAYVNGRKRISRRMAEAISNGTDNKISVDELLADNPKIEDVRIRPLDDAKKDAVV
jgi:DNA transposition AAA+ family ATPase